MAAMHTIYWKQHKDILMQMFKEFRRQNHTDVVIRCEGFSLKAHRAILSATSDFFDLILREHPPHIEPLIVIEGVELACMQAIISYLYTGVMEIDAMKSAKFLSACCYLQIKGLMTYQILNKNDAETETENIVPEPPQPAEEAVEEQEVVVDVQVTGASVCGTNEEDVDLFVFLNTPASSTRLHNKPDEDKDNTIAPSKEAGEEEDEEEVEEEEEEDKEYSPPPKRGRTNATRKGQGAPRESSGYTLAQLSESMEAVCRKRMSLSMASQEYNVPKSVLWRKLQKCDEYKSRPLEMKREQAKKALLGGESMVAVSKKYKIPLATLYRDKNKLITEGQLNIKVRNKSDLQSSINEAADACRKGMSQSEAARKFNIPKSTLWRKLKSME